MDFYLDVDKFLMNYGVKPFSLLFLPWLLKEMVFITCTRYLVEYTAHICIHFKEGCQMYLHTVGFVWLYLFHCLSGTSWQWHPTPSVFEKVLSLVGQIKEGERSCVWSPIRRFHWSFVYHICYLVRYASNVIMKSKI